jgi:hypothetical protein
VNDALSERGYSTQVVANPLVEPFRFSWWLASERSESVLCWDGEQVSNDQIAGVLVLDPGWIDPAGWHPRDVSYMQAETHAALLGWLWSLPCPVVNRYVPPVWYRPQAPLLSWHRLLQRSGLRPLETLVTNVGHEARAYGARLARAGAGGAVYGPLTSPVRYLVSSEEDWAGLSALQRVTPVSLAAPHGQPRPVCVVGERVVWNDGPSEEERRLERPLRAFARAAGLAFLELHLAPTSDGICVVAVETRPRVENFGEATREDIVDGLMQLLTAPATAGAEIHATFGRLS